MRASVDALFATVLLVLLVLPAAHGMYVYLAENSLFSDLEAKNIHFTRPTFDRFIAGKSQDDIENKMAETSRHETKKSKSVASCYFHAA